MKVKRLSKITEEKLYSTNKTLKVISHLPIPKRFYDTIEPTEFHRVLITMGELLYIVRPLAYCIALKIYGTRS